MKLVAVSVLLASVACASAPRGPAPQDGAAEEDRTLARARDERAEKLEEMLIALSVGEHPANCQRACELVVEICHLAKRICAIAARNPDDAGLGGRCGVAQQRCERSRERTASSCSCPER